MGFGIASLVIAVADLFIFGALIVIRFRIPDGWIDSVGADDLERTARWVLAGNVAIILFPLIAIIGAAIAAIGLARHGWREWIGLTGAAANGFLLLIWIIGLLWYVFVYRLDRLYVK